MKIKNKVVVTKEEMAVLIKLFPKMTVVEYLEMRKKFN